MKPIETLITILLIVAFVLSFTVPARASPFSKVPWRVNCENGLSRDGFWDRGFCVPGEITSRTHYARSPSRFYGVGSSYAPGVMEWMCDYRGGCDGYKDGLTVMSCGDIGRTAWVKIPDRPWDGPFLVVDCSQPFHAYVNVVEYGLAVEWGSKTAERWGLKASSVAIVHLGGRPNDGNWGWYYRTWWMEYALEFKQPGFVYLEDRVCDRYLQKCLFSSNISIRR